MVACESCRREMTLSVGCTLDRLLLSGGSYRRTRVSKRSPKCGDCWAPAGSFHHPGCDMERCPRCKHQLIMCGCWEDLESSV